MTRKRVLGAVVPILVVMHLFLHVSLGIEGGAPDLLTLALLLAARVSGMGLAGALGFLLGLLEDAFSVLAFGASTLAMTLLGILSARTRDLFVGDSLRFFFVYFFGGKLLREAVYWIVAGEIVRDPFPASVLVDGGIAAFYVAALGTLLVYVLGGTRALR
ncbi:MAG: rod shape-determining protein MreD [Gemmatimonadetes bacterium]|nr:rod shape-determining protein MreD [Gemmatimonadota bacterium]NNM05522.1 rod shape-determining protein MreD [Gemmatimonadota bacterium]